MQHLQKILILLYLCLLLPTSIQPITIVYNLRVAGAGRPQTVVLQAARKNISAITAFEQLRRRYNGARQTVGGGLGIYTFLKPPFYFKVDFAAAKVTECAVDGTYVSRIQTDDILFSAGYIRPFSDRLKIAFSALFGVPTHRDFGLQAVQFGTGHFGLGLQADGSYAYSANLNHSVVGAVRLIHFLPRDATVQVGPLCKTFNVNLGNTTDLYISHRSSWQKHSVEFGYNPIFSFGAFTIPKIQAVEDNAHAIRNNFFGNYRYTFFINQHISTVLTGISYGFDKNTTEIGIRRGVTLWAGWGINF